jgi:hypothetical protein
MSIGRYKSASGDSDAAAPFVHCGNPALRGQATHEAGRLITDRSNPPRNRQSPSPNLIG